MKSSWLKNQRQHKKLLTWAKEEKDWTVVQWPKVLFSDEIKFCISSSQKLEKEWSGIESKLLEVQCKVSTGSDHLGSPVFCQCWPTVLNQVQSLGNHLPRNLRAPHSSVCWQADGDADFTFQQNFAPAKNWLDDYFITMLDWPINSPDLNLIENLCQEKDEMHQTQQFWRAEGLYQRNQGFHNTPAAPQADRLHAMPHAVIHAQAAPNKY